MRAAMPATTNAALLPDCCYDECYDGARLMMRCYSDVYYDEFDVGARMTAAMMQS
jgi:hypothetical protein